jgi:hypothetical protein
MYICAYTHSPRVNTEEGKVWVHMYIYIYIYIYSVHACIQIRVCCACICFQTEIKWISVPVCNIRAPECTAYGGECVRPCIQIFVWYVCVHASRPEANGC